MSQLRLLTERRFGPLFWTQFLGALNDNLFKTAFVFLITYGALAGSHDGALWTPFLNGLLILPFFMFSAMAGQLADKYEKARLVRLIKLWEVGVMAFAATGFLSGSAWLLAAALFLMGTQSAFFGPVKYAILPQALDENSLVSGNALVGAATFVAILIGTMGGGLLLRAGGFAPSGTALVVLVVALAGVAASRRIPDAPASDPGLRLDWNPLRQSLRACRFAAEDGSVLRAILGISWFWFFGATLLTLFPTYGKNVLHVDEQVVTFFLMLFCVGIGVGALVCGRLANHKMELALVPAGAVGLSVFVLDLFFASLAYEPATGAALTAVRGFLGSAGSLRITLDLFGVAVSGGVFIVPLSALVQQRAPAKKRSRILSATGILSALFMVASAAMTLLLASLGVATVYVYLVLAVTNAAVVSYTFRQLPDLLLRLVVWVFVRVAYRLRVSGLEHVPEDGPVLIAANHITYVDGLILSAAISRPVRFVMYYKFSELPIVGRILRRARVIPIASRKESAAILREALDQIAEALEEGEVVCIFPEGTLTDDGEMREFRRGIERIVARTPVPVVPLGLQGLWGSFFSRARSRVGRFVRGRLWLRVGVAVGQLIPADEVSATHVRARVATLRGAAA